MACAPGTNCGCASCQHPALGAVSFPTAISNTLSADRMPVTLGVTVAGALIGQLLARKPLLGAAVGGGLWFALQLLGGGGLP